jgi:uncharacterized RDD family membrane protein YckC
MKCESCLKETSVDSVFCNWCEVYIPNPSLGTKAGLGSRFVALTIDPFIPVLALGLAFGVLAKISTTLAFFFGGLLPLAYFVWFINKLRQGETPGKMIMGLQVVSAKTGQHPGFGKMLLRELPGRFFSSIFFGIGNIWALFDKNGQAWHDKIGGTVVIKKSTAAAAQSKTPLKVAA